jgi:NADH-quinone oxidoreductase subunit M
MQPILIQAVFLPILLAPVAYLVGRRSGTRVGWLAFAALLYSTVLVLFAAVLGSDYLEEYYWQPIGTFGLRLDGLSVPFAATIYILSTVLAVYSIPYMTHRVEEEVKSFKEDERSRLFNHKIGLYFAYYLVYAAGMAGTVLATNLIQFYIFFELMLIPSFFLIAQFGYGERVKISLMYFLWTHVGALLLLAGILAIGFLGGHFDMALINTAAIDQVVRVWIGVAITVGLFVKLAAFGLHIWLPHAHAEAPTPISALLSPAMIGIGGYAIIRLLIFLLPSAYESIAFAVSIWGLLTMIYGGLMAMSQDDIKRLLAYSSVSQMGYIIFGIASAYYIGVSGSVFQYVSHGTGKALLFMAAGSIILQTHGIRSISRLGGLAGRLPITATAALIGILAIIGVPPMNGFQSEWMLFYGSFAGAITMDSPLKLFITAAALASTPLTAGYTLMAMKRIFYGKTPDHLMSVREAAPTITIPLLFLTFVTILLGIFPSLVTERLIPVMASVLGGGS